MHVEDDGYSDVLQLGVGLQKQSLVLSSSFVQRKQPTLALESSASGSTTTPWVTQLALLNASNSLLSYTDGEELLRIHDKWTLQPTQALAWREGGACTSIKSAGQGFVAAGRNSLLGCWDGRQEGPTISLRGPSRAPYLAVAASEHLMAGGTELHGADAIIDIWDVRQPKAPVLTYAEAHSDDITTLDFHPTTPSVLLSASSDGLIAISDVRQTDEDDSVVGVVNTGASVARAGWGGSKRTFAKQQSIDDDETARRLAQLPSLGAFYSVSDMQTLGIWEADGFGEVMPVRDVRHTHMSITSLLPPWQTEYVIDASADASLLQCGDGEGVTLFCGDQTGGMALMEITPPRDGDDSTSSLPDWALHCTTSGGHDEIVRSVAWDASSYALYSGGEDGRICVWSLSDQQGGAQSGLLAKSPSFVSSQLDDRSFTPSDKPKAAGPDRQPLKGSARSSGTGFRSTKDGTHRSTSYNPY